MPVTPKIQQLGFVVRDAARAMVQWRERFGVGPFFVASEIPMMDFHYRGAPSSPVVTLAVSHWGDMQIELVEQHNDAPSGYREFLDAGPEGLQHMASWSDAYEADLDRCLARGFTVQHEGLSPMDRVTRFAYLASGAHPGTVLELIQMTPQKHRRFAEIAAVCAGWDGSDPVRQIGFPK